MIPLVAPLPQQQPFLPNNAEGGFLVPPPPPPPAPQQHQPLYLHHQQTTMNSHIPPPQHHYFAQQSQQVQQVSSQQAYFVQAPPLQPTLLPQPSQSAVSVSHHLVMGPNGQLFQLQQQPPPGVSYATAPSAGQQPQPQQQHDTILWI
jgi:hypothetical protein